MMVAHRYRFPDAEPERAHELYIRDLGLIELAFHKPKDFLRLDYRKICRLILDSSWVEVCSIHLPVVRLDSLGRAARIIEVSAEMAVALGCEDLVVHPPRVSLGRAETFLRDFVEPLLESFGLRLCWETFLGERRLFHSPSQIVKFAASRPDVYAMCYDTAHMGKHGKVMLELSENLPMIRVLHASNRTEGHKRMHIPVFHPEGVLDFSEILHLLRKARFHGKLVLEYSPEFSRQQQLDYQTLKRVLA